MSIQTLKLKHVEWREYNGDKAEVYVLNCLKTEDPMEITLTEEQARSVKQLKIMDCPNGSLLPNELGRLTEVTELTLDRCEFEKSLPICLQQFRKLEKIWIQFCTFNGHILPPELCRLANLKFVALLGNDGDQSLPNEVGNLTKLEECRFHGYYQTRDFPPPLLDLGSLKRIVLGNSPSLVELPPIRPGQLKNLEELTISNLLRLRSLPDGLGLLENLKSLTISHCPISELPEGIGNLRNMENLFFTSMTLRRLPGELGNLTKLKNLSLCQCHYIESIPTAAEFARLSKLENLVIDGLSCPFEFPVFPRLKILMLVEISNRDSIRNLFREPEWKGTTCLERLDIHCSDLGKECVKILKNLPETVQCLSLQSCNISSLNEFLVEDRLPSGIKSLDLFDWRDSHLKNSFTDPKFAATRTLLHRHEQLGFLSGGPWDLPLPGYEEYQIKLNQCGRMLLRSCDNNINTISDKQTAPIPLAAWNLVLARVQKVAHERRKLQWTDTDEKEIKLFKECEASIVYRLLQGPALLCRPATIDIGGDDDGDGTAMALVHDEKVRQQQQPQENQPDAATTSKKRKSHAVSS